MPLSHRQLHPNAILIARVACGLHHIQKMKCLLSIRCAWVWTSIGMGRSAYKSMPLGRVSEVSFGVAPMQHLPFGTAIQENLYRSLNRVPSKAAILTNGNAAAGCIVPDEIQAE
jgi:hypothetical protein